MGQGELLFIKQKQLLDYWRAAIKNESILGIKINDDNQYKDYLLPKEVIKNNHFSEIQTRELFKKYQKYLIKIKTTPKGEHEIPKEETVLPILISPFVYQRKHEQGKYKGSYKKAYIHPIWIFAYLGKAGNLFTAYPCLLPPWVAREYLSPSYKQHNLITIGDMANYDNFLDKNNINGLHNSKDQSDKKSFLWEDLYKFSEKMLTEVALNLNSCLKENGYIVAAIEQILVMPAGEHQSKNYSATLLKLLDSLSIEEKRFSPLLSRYLTLKQSPVQTLIPILEQVECLANKHLGQMTGDFALANSQRIALHHLFAMKETGQVLAINGPPGTGKTTLLASIIASFWVQAAIKKEKPSIIVVSSANNRAIQNVIDSFENKTTEHSNLTGQGILEKRWIKGVTSFGIYFTNMPKDSYQYYKNNQDGTLQKIEKGKYPENRDYYLENFNQYFGLNIFDLKKAADILHDKMVNLESVLKSIIKIALQYQMTLKKYPKRSEEDLLVTKIRMFKTRLETLKLNSHKLNNTKVAWKELVINSMWYKLIIFLVPFSKKRVQYLITYKIEKFLLNQEILLEPVQSVIENDLNRQDKYYCSQIKRLKKLIYIHEEHLKAIRYNKTELMKWQKQQKIDRLDLDTLFDFNSVESGSEQNILIFLDTKIRHSLFQHAVHYWEAEWIAETFETKESRRHGLDKISKINCFKHMAMLAPCFITTMQSGPGFFRFQMTKDQDFEFMKESIDLLIVDEAGQVNPSYGAGMFALSKNACVVGDNLQLPPIVNLPGAVDIGNMQHFKLIDNYDEYYDISKYGANVAPCSRYGAGNIMKLAQNASFFQELALDMPDQSLKERGLFLTEHRRCVPNIISYCNEYFYKNKMTYNRMPNKDHPFEPMGYAHISGLQESKGSSKINIIEAMSIAKWIYDKKDVFLKLYPGKELDQIFGIITPFTSQVGVIKSALHDEDIILEKNNIGTIHVFQGGEFPVIIFSSVYSYQEYQKNYFFDNEENMLNVAVSRAKDHFFVFGDMDIFDPKNTSTPSGFLANYLFSKPENQLIDVDIVHKFHKKNPDIVRHINSLEAHRQALINAFHVAQKRVFIVSPWITYNAISADNISSLIESAVSRGVEVVIYTDYENSFKNQAYAGTVPENLKILEDAGAKVKIVYNIHAKTLFVDSKIFIEGSFNWLSASRERPKYEASVCCEGKGLEPLIHNFMKRLENRNIFSTNNQRILPELAIV